MVACCSILLDLQIVSSLVIVAAYGCRFDVLILSPSYEMMTFGYPPFENHILI